MEGLPAIAPVILLVGGVLVTVLLGVQILIGYRKIPLKGRTFLKVHKIAAWVVLASALAHGLGGLLFVLSLR